MFSYPGDLPSIEVNDTTVIGKAGKFDIAFRPVKLTSHAGAVLFKDFITRLGVPETYDAEVSVKQRERGYSESQFILAACSSLILGKAWAVNRPDGRR